METTDSLRAARRRAAERVGRSPRPPRHARALRRAQGEAARGGRRTRSYNADDPIVAAMGARHPRATPVSVRAALARGYSIVERGGERWLARDREPLLRARRARAARHAQRVERARGARADARSSRPIAPRRSTCCARSRGCRTAVSSSRSGAASRYIDDSKGTNVGATLAALNGFDGAARADRGRLEQGPGHDAARGRRARQAARGGADRRGGRARSSRGARAALSRPRAPRAWTTPSRARPRSRARRHGAAVAGLREPGHVPRLQGARRAVRSRGARSCRNERRRREAAHARVRSRARVRARRACVRRRDHGRLGVDLDRRQADGRAARAISCATSARSRSAASGWLVAMSLPTELWYRLNWLLLVAALALLVIVLVPGIGHTVNGSRRWLLVGPVTLQASEPARLCLLLYLASYAVRRARRARRELERPRQAAARDRRGRGVLLLLEPDFGAAVVLGRDEPRRAVRRPARACATSCSRRSSAASLLGAARVLVAISARAPHEVPRSVGRSVRGRLPAHAVADRDRPRRVARRRASARACRSCSICPRRTPTSCSPCSSRSSASSARRS